MRPFSLDKHHSGATTRSARRLLFAIGCLILLFPIALLVDGNDVPGLERSAFRAINDLPAFLYGPLWPFMQLGNLLVVPAVALGALALRRFRLALGVLMLGAAKLLLEDVIKSWVFRERPGSVIDDVALRGDTPSGGQAFVSGHAILAVGIATLVHPYLSRTWQIVVWCLAGIVCFGRVYSGAHFPLDVIGGGLLGAAIACVLNFALKTPASGGYRFGR